MSKLLLELAELSYILQTVKAQFVVGVDNTQLFPQDEVENQRLLKQGFERLQANGWLTTDPESGKMDLNNTLVYLITIMAASDIAVMTTRQELGKNQQVVTHYLTEQTIVEQMPTITNQYQFVVVPDIATTVKRIQSVIQIPEGKTTSQILLDKQAYTKIKNLSKAGHTQTAIEELQKQDINQDLATSLVSTIYNPTFRGSVMVFRRENDQMGAIQTLAVMQNGQASWLLRVTDVEHSPVTLESFQSQRFMQYLTDQLR